MVWDISTNCPLFQINLPGFVSVLILKISPSSKVALALVLARSGHKYLLYIDLTYKIVTAVHHFYAPLEINDMSFATNCDNLATLCGVNYMSEWKYQGKMLI